MSGAIAMGSHKITGLTNGSGAQDAAAFGQIPTSATSIGGLLASNNLSDVGTRQTALNNLAGAVTSAQFLRGNGSNIAMSAIQSTDVPTLNQSTTGSAASFTGSLVGDVTGTQGATLVGKIQGVAITTAEANLVSDLNNATSRSATATLLPGEETIFTGSTASQTLTLPASPPASSLNSVTNTASVSVTLAPGAGATLNNFGTSGNIVIPSGYVFAVVYIGTTWYVQAAGPSDFAVSKALSIANGGTGSTSASAALTALGAAPLAGAAFTGNVSMTESAAAGGILTVVNSHTTPTSPSAQYTAQTAADLVVGVSVSGDTVNRLTVDSNGLLSWGAGGASATDTTLSRSSAGQLSTGAMIMSSSKAGGQIIKVANTHATPTTPNVILLANSAADAEIGIGIPADTVYRLAVDSNGKMAWGPGGSTAADTVLQRSSAGVLQLTTGQLNMNSQKITSLANGSASSDAAAFGQIPTSAGTIGGLLAANNLSDLGNLATARANLAMSWKDPVQQAAFSALPSNTYSAGVLTATANAVLVVDGVTCVTGQRILVCGEAAAANNGIYVVTQPGSAGTPYILTRSSDMDLNSQVTGATVMVEQGTVGAGSGWFLEGAGPDTLGTTGIYWTKFTQIISGNNPVALGAAAPGVTGFVSDSGHVHPTTGLVLTSSLPLSGQYLCAPVAYAPGTQTILTTTSATFAAVSSANINTGSFTAPASGTVMVTATAVIQVSSSGDQLGFGLAAHGTVTPMVCPSIIFKAPTTTQPFPYPLVFSVSGLTPGNSYNFDLMFVVNSGGTLSVYAYGETGTTPNLANSGTGSPVVMTVQAV